MNIAWCQRLYVYMADAWSYGVPDYFGLPLYDDDV